MYSKPLHLQMRNLVLVTANISLSVIQEQSQDNNHTSFTSFKNKMPFQNRLHYGEKSPNQKSQGFLPTYLYPERLHRIAVALLSLKFQQKSKKKYKYLLS